MNIHSLRFVSFIRTELKLKNKKKRISNVYHSSAGVVVEIEYCDEGWVRRTWVNDIHCCRQFS